MKRALSFFCVSIIGLFLSWNLPAQTRSVRGTVVDESGQGVIGAAVMVKGTTNGVATDNDGRFLLNCAPNAILVVSSVGYDEVEVPLNGRTELTIPLSISQELLDDVVVIGYGTTRAKNFTGSVDVVKLADSPVADMGLQTTSDLLRGRLSGVRIGAESSNVGQNSSILVRGRKSISSTSTSPLIVLNGVIFPGNIEDIDPNSIEQVSVLKDATSLAAYGSKAANGVIMVTTKKGQEGKPTITFSTTQQISNPTYIPKVLSPEDYIIFRNARAGKQSDFQSLDFMTYMEEQNYKAGIVYDWYDMCLQTGWNQNYNLNFSGRTANSNYFVGLGRTDQRGYIIGDHFTRNNVSVDLTTNISKIIEVGVNMAFTNTLNDGNQASIRYDLYCLSPYGSAYLPDGRLRFYTDGISPSRYNPLWPVEYGGEKENRYKNLNLGGHIQINIPWVEGLNFRVNASYGERNTTNMSFRHENYYVQLLGEMDIEGVGQNPEYFSLKDANGSISESKRQNWVIDNILSYAHQFGDHYLSTSLVYTRDSDQSSGYQMTGSSFTAAGNTLLGWHGLSNADSKDFTSPSYSLHTDVGYLARAMYSYRDTYHLNASIRRDGSSVFGAESKWGNFPAFGAAWTVSNEPFMKNVSWVDMLKLKISWGKNGAQTLSPYGTLSTVSLAKDGGIPFYSNETIHWGQKISTLGNPALGWQTTTSWNGGFEGDFFKGRVHFDVNAYYSKTTDQIFNRTIPVMTAGITKQNATMGQVDNKGIEINATTVNVKNKDFTWTSDYIFTLNRNKIVDLYGDGQDDIANGLFLGHPINVIYNYKVAYIDQDGSLAKPGEAVFYAADGRLTENPHATAKQLLGSTDDNFRLSLANTFNYKNLQLYVFFQGVFSGNGYGLRNNTFAYQTFNTTEGNALDIPFYYPGRTDTDCPHAVYNESKYVIFNPYGYVRLQDVSLSYNMRTLAQKVGLANARVTLSGRNLFYVAPKWRMADPEMTNGYSVGMPRAFTLGLNVTF